MNTDTVTIACKLPNGLRLDIGTGAERRSVTLNGNRLPINADGLPLNKFEIAGKADPLLAESYGLTPNVPADFWAQWAKENANYGPYAKGLIFAQGEHSSAVAQAKEVAGDIRNGFEPMSREKPAPGITAVEKD